MNTLTESRIEYLKSEHKDAKVDLSPFKRPFPLKLAAFMFQTVGRLFPKLMVSVAVKFFTSPRIRAKHRRSDELLDAAQRFNIDVKGRKIQGYSWGDETHPAILLTHGWESRGTALRMFVPGLLEKGYRIVALDAPAHGESEGKSTTLIDYADSIVSMIKHIGGIEGIIAHSFGCGASMFALHSYDSLQLKRLVMIAPSSKVRKVLDRFYDQIGLPDSVGKAMDSWLEKKYNFNMEDVDFTKMYHNGQVEQTVFIHDKLDNVVPFKDTEELFETWSNSQLVVTEGYGHYRLVKNPDLQSKILSYF